MRDHHNHTSEAQDSNPTGSLEHMAQYVVQGWGVMEREGEKKC